VQAEGLEARQREREWFRALTIPPGMWVIIRADGRGFSRLTEEHFAKPFDERMREHMTVAAEALMTEFGAAYGCTHSDEISVVLPPGTGLFGRGLCWEDYPKTGHDPRTGTPATTIRRRLRIDDQLPMKDQYRAMVLAAVTTTPRP
jgi:hypothetical protein